MVFQTVAADIIASPDYQIGNGRTLSLAFAPDSSALAVAGTFGILLDTNTFQQIQGFYSPAGRVNAIEVSPEGDTVASANADGTIEVWSVETGDLLYKMIGHTGPATCVAYSPQGDRVASGSEDSSIRIWNASTGTLLHTFTYDSVEVVTVKFTPDGGSVMTANNGVVRLIDTQTGAILRQISTNIDIITAAAISSDGAFIAIGYQNGRVRIWDAAGATVLRNILAHTSSVHAVSFSSDGNRLVSGASDGQTKFWDTASGGLLHTISDLGDEIRAAVFSPDDSVLATASFEGEVRLYGGETYEPLSFFGGHEILMAHQIALEAENPRLVTSGSDNNAIVWDIERGTAVCSIRPVDDPVHNQHFTLASISSDGNLVATGDDTGMVRLWDANSGELRGSLSTQSSQINDVSLSPDGSRVLATSFDARLHFWNTETAEEILNLPIGILPYFSHEFSRDGKRLITSGGTTDTQRLLDGESGALIATLPESFGSPAFSPDSTKIVTTSNHHPGEIDLWDAETGSFLITIAASGRPVFSPDSTAIVANQSDTAIGVYDVTTGMLTQSYPGHSATIRTATFSPDGPYLLSVTVDRKLHLWNASTSQYLRTYDGSMFSGVLEAVHPLVEFSPDGSRILSHERDGTAVWVLGNVTPRSAQVTGGQTVTINGRNFIPDAEPSVYFGGNPATGVELVSESEITCVVPVPTTVGDYFVDIRVEYPGVDPFVIPEGFRYKLLDTVWLDLEAATQGVGTKASPLRTLNSALEYVAPGGTIKILPGSAATPAFISKPVTVEAPEGTARLGG